MVVGGDKRICLYCGSTVIKQNCSFCDKNCSSSYRYNLLKDDPEYKEEARKRFKEWYNKNKIRQTKNVLKHYHKNKKQWAEVHFTQDHKKDIMQFINPNCSCGKKTRLILHKKYGDVPKLKKGPMKKDNSNKELLKKYTKENLIGVCSMICLKREKTKIKREEEHGVYEQ